MIKFDLEKVTSFQEWHIFVRHWFGGKSNSTAVWHPSPSPFLLYVGIGNQPYHTTIHIGSHKCWPPQHTHRYKSTTIAEPSHHITGHGGQTIGSLNHPNGFISSMDVKEQMKPFRLSRLPILVVSTSFDLYLYPQISTMISKKMIKYSNK